MEKLSGHEVLKGMATYVPTGDPTYTLIGGGSPTYTPLREVDPHGKALHEPGSKGDAGKIRPSLVLGGFARALTEVCKVGTYGAVKYSDNGWMEVPNGEERYDDAKLRHWLKEKSGEASDPDTELVHAAHEAWNALARLDLMLRKRA